MHAIAARRTAAPLTTFAALALLLVAACKGSDAPAPAHAPGAAVAPAPAQGEGSASAPGAGAQQAQGEQAQPPTEAQPEAPSPAPSEEAPAEQAPSDQARTADDAGPTDGARPAEAVDPDRRLLSAYREIYCHQKRNDQRGVITVWQQYGYTPETWAAEAQAAARRAAEDPKGFGARWARISATPCP